MKNFPQRILITTLSLMATLAAQGVNFTGPDGGSWSDAANWSTGSVPTASDEVTFPAAEDASILLDGDYAIKLLTDGFGAGSLTLDGPGTLTIDTAQSAVSPGLINATGEAGGVTLINGNLAVNNSGGARTMIRTSNSDSNIVRFGPESNLTLATGLQTGGESAGSIEFNGNVSGGPIFVGSQNASIGEGHNSTDLISIVFFNNSLLKIYGGTVLSSTSKFQVNGTNATVELNGANAVNGANVVVGGSNDFLMDVNTNQENLGFIIVNNGGLTIDVDPAVTNLSFSSCFFQNWGTGSVTITGFKEGTIRFGTDGSGLTKEQLAAINNGAYSLTPDGYLTEEFIDYWAGFEIDAEGFVSMSPWIESLAYVDAAPYIWIEEAGWTYMEENVGVTGMGWFYAFDLEALDIVISDNPNYGYSFALDHWVYLPFDVSPETADWSYVL